MEKLNTELLVQSLKDQYKALGLNYFDLSLAVLKESKETITSIRSAAIALRTLGFEAGVVLDTDEFYHVYYIKNDARNIWLQDSGCSEYLHSGNQDTMQTMADKIDLTEEPFFIHFANLKTARDKVFCNIMHNSNLILFPDFKVTRMETRKEGFLRRLNAQRKNVV